MGVFCVDVFRLLGFGDGERNQRREILRMLGADSEGTEDGLRRGHTGRALPKAEAKAEQEMRPAVRRRLLLEGAA